MLCISKAIFEKLVLAAQELLVKPVYVEYVSAAVQENELLPRVPNLLVCDDRKAGYLEYTPSRIWNTRDSKLWQWRRLNEWWREYRRDEFIDEKRHILV